VDLGFRVHATSNQRQGEVQDLGSRESRKEIEFGNKQSLAAEGVGEVELWCVTSDREASGDLEGGVIHFGSWGKSIPGEKGHGGLFEQGAVLCEV
jgi:hypothetical protein